MARTWRTDAPVGRVWINRTADIEAGEEVPIRVTGVGTDEVGQYMVVVPLPDEPSILRPKTGKEWAALDASSSNTPDGTPKGNYLNRYKITGGKLIDASKASTSTPSGKLYYEIILGKSPEVGSPIVLYNIFSSSWDFDQSPILTADNSQEWCKTYMSPGAGFMRDHGPEPEHVLLVNGFNGDTKRHQVGAFKSRTMKDWKNAVPVNPVFPDKSYGSAASMYTTGDIFELEDGRFLAYLTIIGAEKWTIGWVTFDRDFGNVEYSKDCIVTFENGKYPPNGCSTPATIRYRDKYRMMFVWRGSSHAQDWQVWEAIADHPKGPFDTAAPSLCNPAIEGEPDSKYSYRSSHCDTFGYFEWAGDLYMLVGGTARWAASGSKGKREYGCFLFNEETSRWEPHPNNPVFINPLYADSDLWGKRFAWASDHIGGNPVFHLHEADKTLYLFVSANHGTDTYQIAYASIPVEEGLGSPGPPFVPFG